MNDKEKTKAQLLVELRALREQVQTLDKQDKEHTHQEKVLQEEKDLLYAMVSNLPDCHIFLKDKDSRFITTNDFLLKLLGLKTLRDIIGKTDFDFFPRELAEQYYQDEQEIIRSGKPMINREEKTVDEEGRAHWLLTSKIPLYSQEGKIVGIAGLSQHITPGKNIMGIVGLSHDITDRKRLAAEREKLISELQAALAKVKTLSGLLPICAACKQIRDDQGYWHQVEGYIRTHSAATFTHGLCPDCVKKALAKLDQTATQHNPEKS